MDKDEKGAEEVQETDSEKDTRGKTAKRKFVSQSQFDDLQSMLAGMQSEMSKLVSVLQDSVIPTKRLRSTEPNATTSQSEGLENQFLANSNERQCRMPSNENQFLLQQNGNQFATILSGDQLPTFQPSADILNEDLIPETSPLSLSTETIEGQFVPPCDNGLTPLPFSSFPSAKQQGAKLHFVEDEAVVLPISEGYAKYAEDCCRTHILTAELTNFKESFKRPQKCPALSVPTINPNLWAQLPKEYKENDKRLQNSQSLLAKGLTGVVHIKDTILQPTSRTDQFSLFHRLSEQIDACVALLGNTFLESSYCRRDLLKPAINPRFHSLCGSTTPVTNCLFGDNFLESAKTIQSSQKMTRDFTTGRGNFSSNRPANRPANENRSVSSSAGNLNYRGQTNQSLHFRQHPRLPASSSNFSRKSQTK